MHRLVSALLAVIVCLLASCADPMVAQRMEERRLAISSEPRGDWFIGRRFHIEHTHMWGYVRRPGQSWDDSKLVMINERIKRAPDRLPEVPTDNGNAFGYDNNYEYKLWGQFTGQKIYDPNSDLFLPEFLLTRYELINSHGGWLFHPQEKRDGEHLLRWEKQQ